jgi:hypothetical protein
MGGRLASVGESTHGDHGGGGGGGGHRRQLGATAASPPILSGAVLQEVDETDEDHQERVIVTYKPIAL